MSHLSLETLARIVDDGPSVEETRHLDACPSCRLELDGMRDDVYALSTLPDVSPAPDQWASLERRLVEEGLIRQTPHATAWWSARHLMQAAAALLLFAGGSAAGRMTAGEPAMPVAQVEPSNVPYTTSPAPAPTAVDALMASEPAATDDGAAPQQQAVPPAARRPVTLAANTMSYEPQTVEEAAAVLQELDRLYLAALTRYAEMTSGAQQGDPVARLAALQSIVHTTQAALAEAPADPVLNGVHLTAMAQRDATLRQVAANTGERWY